jgi:hypothetical protein
MSDSTLDVSGRTLLTLVVGVTIVTTAGCLGGLSGSGSLEDSQTTVPFVVVNERGVPVHAHVIVENAAHFETVVNENLTIEPGDGQELASLKQGTTYNVWVEVNQSDGQWHNDTEIKGHMLDLTSVISPTGVYLQADVE